MSRDEHPVFMSEPDLEGRSRYLDFPYLESGKSADAQVVNLRDRRSTADTVESLRLGTDLLRGDVDGFAIIGQYQGFLRASFSPATVKLYSRCVARFLCDVGASVEEITETDVATWLEQFPYRSSARGTYYQALLHFFLWAMRNGHRKDNPLAQIARPKVGEKQPRALTIEEVYAVIQAAARRSPVRAAAMVFLFNSGARINEFLNVRFDDLEEEGIRLRKTKTGKERIIPWNPDLKRAVEVLREHFGESEFILPRTDKCVWLWCTTAGKEAGIKKVHPHLFRSTAATTMMTQGAKLHSVRDLLGHDSIKTTSRYLAPSKQEMADAVQLLSGIATMGVTIGEVIEAAEDADREAVQASGS